MSRPILGPTWCPIPWVPVKQPGHEAEHLHASSADVKDAWSYTSTVYIFMAWYVVKCRDSFTYTLIIFVRTESMVLSVSRGSYSNEYKTFSFTYVESPFVCDGLSMS
jgi:hypothetical protein